MATWTDCKPGFFWHEFAAQYSSMLLAVMSIEKFIALYFPLKAKSYCTVGTAKWVTSILAVVMAGLILLYSFRIKLSIKLLCNKTSEIFGHA